MSDIDWIDDDAYIAWLTDRFGYSAEQIRTMEHHDHQLHYRRFVDELRERHG